MIPVTFSCESETLAGNLHPADGTTGVLIVTGGGQIRAGPQRLFLHLASDLSASGTPVFRFDRRGIGDSSGTDAGFEDSGPDIAAAAAELRMRQPHVERVIGVGLCDGATAMILSPASLDGLILLNPWIIEDSAPPSQGEVTAHYKRRLLQPENWKRLLRGRVNPVKALASFIRARAHGAPAGLEMRVEQALASLDMPIHAILSSRDRTADAVRPLTKRAALASTHDIDADHAFSAAESLTALKARISHILS
ncbi:hydrolase 1, exosortase A system-associated [Pacificimonas sp. WHA3]|uniref:Hydrolase 1, exosortase A system-associated n=1 Tax=Pacificimonas pallii TaxID=2827236 RepID=A0ABS6SFE5_9SPHN|nr:hydrolase 1, exosortase A system-associated [Pacificimonas pallii]MBV7257119.1 hydrolase 1, exosortase A system-associated [Pacificimonas pallii]